MTCCAYSCTQYSLHTQYMLLTHADDLLCLQLHTVRSPYTVHAANQCWWLAVPTAVHSSLHTQYMLLTSADDFLCLQLYTTVSICFHICLSLAHWKIPNFSFMKIITFPSLSCTNVQRTPLTNCVFLTTNADSAVTTDWAPQEFALCLLSVLHWRSTSDGGQPYRMPVITTPVAAGNVVRQITCYNFNTRILNWRAATEQRILNPFRARPPDPIQ